MDLRHLENRCVDVRASGTAEDVAAAIAVRELSRIRPSRSGRAERSIEPPCDGWIGEFARAEAIGTAAAGVRKRRCQRRRERQATLHGKDSIYLPATEQRMQHRI